MKLYVFIGNESIQTKPIPNAAVTINGLSSKLFINKLPQTVFRNNKHPDTDINKYNTLEMVYPVLNTARILSIDGSLNSTYNGRAYTCALYANTTNGNAVINPLMNCQRSLEFEYNVVDSM